MSYQSREFHKFFWAINCCSYKTHGFHKIFAFSRNFHIFAFHENIFTFCIFVKFSHFALSQKYFRNIFFREMRPKIFGGNQVYPAYSRLSTFDGTKVGWLVLCSAMALLIHWNHEPPWLSRFAGIMRHHGSLDLLESWDTMAL